MDLCFICGNWLSELARPISNPASDSESSKPFYKLIETFLNYSFEEEHLDSLEICETCVEKIEEYERICQRAAEIQDEISELFQANQKRQEEELLQQQLDLTCQNCLAQFISEDELNEHDCTEEIIMEEVYHDESPEIKGEESLEDFSGEQKTLSSKKKSNFKPDSRTLFCNFCQMKFEKKRDYIAHVKFSHLSVDAPLFCCALCEKSTSFISEDELKLHRVLNHPEDPSSKSFECPTCNKSYSAKALLSRHFGIHSADNFRPHYCEICSKTFFHYSSYHAHLKAHNDIRDFICEHCSKAFRSQSHLSRHIKTHTKTKNHVCSECGVAFAEKYNLTVHYNAHFGINRRKKPNSSQIKAEEV